MKSAIIVAAANNGVIGRNNQLPWHLPQDLAYFKSMTLGKPIIMGRKTYESIGKPLPGRLNIVVTRQRNWLGAEGVQVAFSLPDALAIAENISTQEQKLTAEVMIIGGAELYREALPLVERVYVTRVDLDVEGDAFFSELSPDFWVLESVTEGDEKAKIKHRFLVYSRSDSRRAID